MKLKSDKDGFLSGEVVADIKRSERLLGVIKTDISAIRKLVLGLDLQGGQTRKNESQSKKRHTASPVAVPRQRNTQGRQVKANSSALQIESQLVAAEPQKQRAKGSIGRFMPTTDTTQDLGHSGRDSRGRFISNDSKKVIEQNRSLNGLADKISGAISPRGDIGNVDPAINAFNEVAQPLSRGYQAVFSGSKEKKQNNWFGKIFKELKLSRTQDSEYNKSTKRILGDIEENTVSNKSPGGGIPIPSLKGAGGIGDILKMIPALSKGLLKKIPLIAGLLSTLGAFFDVFGNESDDSLTRREKDQENGSSIGGAAGTVGGMIAGAKLGAMAGAFAGPIGAAIGAAVGAAVGAAAGMFFGDQAGQIIGGLIGSWTNDLRNADIPGMISSTWSEALTGFTDAWSGMKEASENALNWISDKADFANDLIKEKTGIDVKEITGTLQDKASDIGTDLLEKGSTAKSWLGEQFDVAKTWMSENTSIGKGVNAVKNTYKKSSSNNGKFDQLKAAMEFDGAGNISGLTDAQTRAFAAETQRTESGGDLRAENEHGYIGKYQFGAGALADSGLVNLEKLKAAKKTSGKDWFKGGQTDFLNNNKNWKIKGGKEAFLSDSSLQDRTFVENTNRNIATGRRFGAISKNDSAERIAAYSKAAHLKGAGGANKLFLNGVDGVDANGTSASKYANDGSRAMTSLAPVVAASMKTLKMPPVSKSIPSPKAPRIPSAQKINDAPSVSIPITNSSDKKPVIVTVSKDDVGQDIKDRNIAMIATGGLSKY